MHNSDKNRQSVTASAIVAKAVVRRNGRINIIVVFQQSTLHEFYWVFQARSARSPRRLWKLAGYYSRDIGFNAASKPYHDFGSFVEYYARVNHAEAISARALHAKRLAALLVKTQFESIHSDWSARDESKQTFDLVGKRNTGRSGFYFNNRNRANDEMKFQADNEVLVYEDDCDECMTRHAFAHWPDGKKMCKVGFLEMRKNPGFDYRGFKPATGFRFTYHSFAGA